MNQIKPLITETMVLVKSVLGASRIVKRDTQQIVINMLSINHMQGLDRLPVIASMMVNGMTHLDAIGFKLFIETHFPMEWMSDEKMFNPETIKDDNVKLECKAARDKFMEDFNNNYWLWVSRNVKAEKKEIDWMKRFDSAMNSLEDPDKGKLSVDDILLHIIERKGLTLNTFMTLLAPKQVLNVAKQNDALIEEQMADVA